MLKSTDFAAAHIPLLIRRLAVPASVGFIFNTLFNVVDTYYGGTISTAALAAMGLTFPVFFIILAMGMGMGTGTTALISQSLGAGRNDEAEKIGFQAITFSLINAVFLTILGLIIAPSLFQILGATNNYLDIAVQYMDTILYGTLFFLINSILNALLTARGDTRTYRDYLIVGFVLNLILDPWFIYGGFGVSRAWNPGNRALNGSYPVSGSHLYDCDYAQAQDFFSMPVSLILSQTGNISQRSSGRGFPASLNMLTVAIGIFVITYFASHFGKEAVAAYGIATRIEQIALLPTIGLNIAALTLAGQNLGANRPDRVYESWKLNLRYGLTIITIGTIAALLLARQLMQTFTADIQVIEIGVEYLRIAALFFFAYIFLNISVFDSSGDEKTDLCYFCRSLPADSNASSPFYVAGDLSGMGDKKGSVGHFYCQLECRDIYFLLHPEADNKNF